jgi:hypothetical protein
MNHITGDTAPDLIYDRQPLPALYIVDMDMSYTRVLHPKVGHSHLHSHSQWQMTSRVLRHTAATMRAHNVLQGTAAAMRSHNVLQGTVEQLR